MSDASFQQAAHVFPAQADWCAVRIDERSVVHVTGEIDCATVPALASALESLTARGGHVSVDLAGVEFIDAAGLSVLCAAAQAVRTQRRIMLRNPSPRVRRVLEVTGAAHLFGIVDSPDTCEPDYILVGGPVVSREASASSLKAPL